MTDETLQQLGATLRAARLERGLTVRAVAEAAGTSPAAYSRLETGQASMTPRADVLAALVRVLGVDVEELYAYTGAAPTGGLPDLPVYLRAKYNLPPEHAARFEDLMREITGGDTSTAPEGTRDGDST